MTKEEHEHIFGKSHPVDVDGLGKLMNNMPLDLNAYNTGEPKGISMFKQASSPSFQRLNNAIHKLAQGLNYNSGGNPVVAASAVNGRGTPGDTTKNIPANFPPFSMMHDGAKMQTQETVKLSGADPVIKNV